MNQVIVDRTGAARCFRLLALMFTAAAGCGPEHPWMGGGGRGDQGPSAGGSAAKPEPEPLPPDPASVWPAKAIWVIRQRYDSPEQIANLMENCRQAGFNTVLFQVRGNGTAFYRSEIEPMDHADPGFDQLTVACREAHRRGMALQAWINVMPGWRGPNPPSDAGQLYNAHPDWFWYSASGERHPLINWYVSLNPCLPEVRAYLVSVAREIVERYPVDGLHLDYIRMPFDESPKGVDYSHDAPTLALFKEATGKTPAQDKAAWSAWRTEQVTRVVADIRAMMRQVRPRVLLTAACWANIEGVRKEHFQDGPAWLRQGLIDAAFVMNYAKDTRTFKLRQEAWHRASGGKPAAAGIGVYMHESPEVTAEQVRLALAWGQGLAIFSSNALFGRRSDRQKLETIRPLLASEPAARAAATASPARPVTPAKPAAAGSGSSDYTRTRIP